MTKQETAQQIIRQVLEFMVDNEYVESTYYPAGKNQADIAADDIEQLQDIAQASIEEFMRYVAKGTLRSK
jgi:phenylacetate-coenzyme A ligase PaaK-like adenylate-forming protein